MKPARDAGGVARIRTRGLTHLALAVADPERSARFYVEAFGARIDYRDPDCVQVHGPGPFDVLSFERDPERAGAAGGVLHFGFRLESAGDIDRAVEQAVRAGARLLRRGEHGPGLPFAYLADPDGYELELWFE